MMDYAKSQLAVLIFTFLVVGASGYLFAGTAGHTGRYDWNTWSSWSTCHHVDCTQATTYTHTHRRHRTCWDHLFHHQAPTSHCGTNHEETQTCANHCAHWLSWSHWATCSATCDGGHTTRTRHCVSGHGTCVGSSHETMACSTTTCSLAHWLSWSHWTTCSATCNGGHTTRTRHCASGHGMCIGNPQEAKACTTTTCSPHWSAWSDWSSCSASCGGGTTIRVRHCGTTSQTCNGDPFQTLTCGTANCAPVVVVVDGGWGAWGTSGLCSKSCGVGLKTRLRSCDDPAPTHGGKTCVGGSTTQTTCTLGDCPIDGHWGTWEHWGSCSQTCDLGVMSRQRSCDSPAPQHGGKTCPGARLATIQCQIADCPTDGGWGDWTTWSTCAATCGAGQGSRTRTCNNPAPQNHGKSCGGISADLRKCESPACPITVDGGWSNYTTRPCSVTCGTGVVVKFRSCSSPAPAAGGRDCDGSAADFSACTEQDCPKDGGWSSYTTRPCSVTCGAGVVVKFRSCSNPAPAAGGRDCDGSAADFSVCTEQDCPKDGGLTDWTDWTSCNVVCGYGHTWRSRTCTNPTPGQGDTDCSGKTNERQLCHNGTCPDDLKTCYNSQISDLVYASPYVVDVTPSPQVTCGTPVDQQEASLHKLCQVNSFPTDWRMGTKMSGNCENTPLFVPIALISKRNLDRTYGILLDYYNDVIQVVDMSCNMQVKVYRLNTTENDYHIVLL